MISQVTNTQSSYGTVAKCFHWGMALLILSMLTIGLYMTNLPLGLQKLKFYGWHKEWGVLVFILVILRLGWRLGNTTPVLPSTMPAWQKLAAHGSHLALYACMFALPTTGWLMSSAAGLPVSFFGLFVLPDLIAPNIDLRLLLTTTHATIAYGLIAIICVHVGAALQHHFIDKDDILVRMLP